MRNYWIKIAARAFGIFVLGMLLITAARGVKHKVTTTINSSDPIPIPLIGLVPFRLGESQLGSLSRIEFLRSDPEHISGVRVIVKLADSVSADQLRECRIALDQVDNIDEHTAFRCQVGDSGAGLEPFGMVIVKGTSDSFPLLLPEKAVIDLRQTTFHLSGKGFEVTSPGDRARRAMEARTDSMREVLDNLVEARQDSVDQLREQADQLEDSATSAPTGQRRAIERGADSVRAQMRAMVDRLRADEARLAAFDEVSGLSPEELDSMATMGRRIADSVRREVAKTLREARVQVERVNVEAGTGSGVNTVRVAPPAPPVPPKP